MTTESTHHRWRFRSHLVNTAIAIVFYVLSSGPMLGLAFWLRERTGMDQFYAVMWLYYPVVVFAHKVSPIGKYIEWWVVNVFHTVGPG
jgi:hypothetical protein